MAALGALVLGSTACGGSAPAVPAAFTSHHSISTAEGTRTYRMFDPGDARALVIALHPLGSNGDDMAAYTRFDAQAVHYHFVVVYPDGLKGAWNAGFCCPPFHAGSVDDAGFLTQVIDLLAQPGWKVFVIGLSNGAMMAYRLACNLQQRISAIGLIASDTEACSPRPPLPAILQFQGTSDHYTGNRTWSLHDGTWMRLPMTATTYWQRLGAEVRLVRVDGGNDQWYRPTRLHHLPDASAEMARFFARRPS